MKKLLLTGLAGLLLLAVAVPSFAANKGKHKERTLKGEALCAKCALHESDKCQTVIQVEGKNGKKISYYLADNEVAKDFHDSICKGPKKVVATGTAKMVDGKHQFTATKIKLADEK